MNEKGIPLIHEEIKMEIGFRADVILDNKVIVEIKVLTPWLIYILSKCSLT